MTEDEVNLKCKEWLIQHGYKYKGVLNAKPADKANPNGYGQIPAPDGTRSVLIDHQGVKDQPIDLVWVEAKGSDVGMSQLLEGFSRMAYAVYHGGGKGLLAIPTAEFELLITQSVFLRSIGIASERTLGLLNADVGKAYWL